LARQTTVKIYFCPSRRSSTGQVSLVGDQDCWTNPAALGPPTPGALGDYAACIGTDGCDGLNCFGAVNGSFRVTPISLVQISDGTSNTIFVGDKYVPRSQMQRGPLDSSLYNGNYLPASCRSAGPNAPLVVLPDDTSSLLGVTL